MAMTRSCLKQAQQSTIEELLEKINELQDEVRILQNIINHLGEDMEYME